MTKIMENLGLIGKNRENPRGKIYINEGGKIYNSVGKYTPLNSHHDDDVITKNRKKTYGDKKRNAT